MKEFACFERFVPFNPGIFAVVESGECIGNHFERFRFFAHTNNITGLNLVRGDVNNVTVNGDVAVCAKNLNLSK